MTSKFNTHQALNYSDENTVPRHMVHRAAVSEVFLTGAIQCADLHFQCTAQLPRAHSYFNDHTHRERHYDMLLLLEVFRQTSIYVSHSFLNVELSNKFIYMDSDTRVLNREALVVGDRPASAVVDVKIVDEYYRNGIRSGVTLDMTMLLNNDAVAHKRMGIRWMDSDTWARMRVKGMGLVPVEVDLSVQLPEPTKPLMVGRQSPTNVVIGQEQFELEGEFHTKLIVDQNNAGIFDHPLDHIPGILLLEGFRQTGLIVANRYQGISPDEILLSRCQVRFTRFGEFGLNTRCRVTSESVCLADDQETVMMSMVIEQEGVAIATASLEFFSVNNQNHLHINPRVFAVEGV